MSNLVRLSISTEFITQRVIPTANELGCGYRVEQLSPTQVIELSIARRTAGLALAPWETEILRQGAVQRHQIGDGFEPWEVGDAYGSGCRVWLYLALAWLLERATSTADPLGIVEMLYADFGYPEEIKGLVRWMPAEPGQELGVPAIERRWRTYVEQTGAEFRDRTDRMLRTSADIDGDS